MAVGQTIAPAKTQFFDQNGDPLSLGTVTFYIPGTTTLKDVWTDFDCTTPHANPLTLDAAGRALIYGQGTYRQIVKTASGSTVWDAVVGFDAWSSTNDGSGSGLDADLLDGQHGTYYINYSNMSGTIADGSLPTSMANKTLTGTTVITGTTTIGGGTPWTTANDGSGSTLDADLLDGVHASDLTWKFVEKRTVTSGTNVDFTSLSAYTMLRFVVLALSASTAAQITVQVGVGGVFSATGYVGVSGAGLALAALANNADYIVGAIDVVGLNSASSKTLLQASTWTASGSTSNPVVAVYNTERAEDCIRFALSTGTYDGTGEIYVWATK